LRDWSSKETAIERLRDLADASAGLSVQDRKDFREEYLRAWSDVCSMGLPIPPDIPLVVSRHGQNTIAESAKDKPAQIIVTADARDFASTMLSAEEAPFGDRHGGGLRPVALPRCVRHNFLLPF